MLSLLVLCSTLWSCTEPQVFEEISEGESVATAGAQAIFCPQYPPPFALDLPRNPKTLEIHVDASGSMGGYTHNPRSQYNRTLELLEQITTSYQDVSPSYFRAGFDESSGQGSQEISRSKFRKAQKIEFYDGTTDPKTFPGVTSNLKSAILPNPSDRSEGFDLDQRLLVLVTDLSPDDGDTVALTEGFKQILTGSTHVVAGNDGRTENERHMAVALIGLRSEFKGYLQSPKVELYPFPSKDYSTEDLKPEQYRPFYIIVAGHVQYVQDFLSKLVLQSPSNGDSSSFSLTNTTIFYPSLLSPLNVRNAQFKKSSGFAEWDQYALSDNNVFVEFLDPSLYKRLGVPSDQDELLAFSYSLPLGSSVESTIDLSTQWITPKTLRVKQDTEVYSSSLRNFTLSENLFEIEPTVLEFLEGQSATLSVSLEPKLLPSRSIHISKIYLETVEYQEPEWWNNWDFDQVLQSQSLQADTISEENILATTPGLRRFSRNLADFTVSIMRSGALCHAFQRD